MFIPREPVLENQFTKYGPQTATGSSGIGNVVCYAGAVVYLDPAAPDEEAHVYRYDQYTASPEEPFGFSEQKVKTGYHEVHPTGYYMPGDLGSSDAVAQPTYDAVGNITGTRSVPMAVAHLGIWMTTHYTCAQTTTPGVVDDGDHMKAGDDLFVGCNCESRVTNNSTLATDNSLDNEALMDTVVAKVVIGASAAKCTVNVSNQALYPIMVKLLV